MCACVNIDKRTEVSHFFVFFLQEANLVNGRDGNPCPGKSQNNVVGFGSLQR